MRGWADGKVLLYDIVNPGGGPGRDMGILPLTADGGTTALKPSILMQTPFNEGWGQFSSDGRWILYTSDESQRFEVYASPFAPPHTLGGKRQISVGGMIAAVGLGGGSPRWRDRREIFYVNANHQLMATEVRIPNDRLDVGATRPLFATLSELRQAFEVSADGLRFLLQGTTNEGATAPITLVQNWPAGSRH